MRTLPLAEARNNLSKIIDDIERTHDSVTITRNGKPSAVVISVDDYESMRETFALLEDDEDRSPCAFGRTAFQGGLSRVGADRR